MGSVTEGIGWKKLTAGFFSTVVLGAVGSGLWDVAAKPALSWLGQHFLTLVSLGSDSYRDAAYVDAAMDPTSRSALFTEYAIILTPVLLMGFLLLRRGIRGRHLSSESDPRKRAPWRGFFWGTVVGFFIAAGAQFTMFVRHSQSVLIWRTFHNNLNRLAASISVDREREYLARFASLKTRREYKQIDEEMHRDASAKGVTLPEDKLW